MTDTFKHSHL